MRVVAVVAVITVELVVMVEAAVAVQVMLTKQVDQLLLAHLTLAVVVAVAGLQTGLTPSTAAQAAPVSSS
jgi:hypothetical protein